MTTQHWIFLSPHLDDVTLSCGGLVWCLTQHGYRVEIWTLMSGFPPDEAYSEFARQNHQAWGKSGREAIVMRRAEDRAACDVLGVTPRHFEIPDAIYRRDPASSEFVVNNDEELFSRKPETTLVGEIASILDREIQPEAVLVMPMGLGGHIDHRAVRTAGEKLPGDHLYYIDYPYILWSYEDIHQGGESWQRVPHDLNQDALEAWQDAVLCYTSQLSSFWRDEEETRLALNNYLAGGGGRLWRKAEG